ncbi:hypothetical protein A1O3_05368 [Capronia epimyces CBS 606.96]|uniref:HORMA domain-containing protein n=1 Tax=Capronia epimyces CBS 606.96 TaxID=1182542 RepID=W9XWT6_9EURO|nr:uncharacterized protein A1O3_05368 [Capronia epimyces CBS 606.96]EXJ84698.1 hypothetical protein A1O3_05368 [Capronia epimyces CBS 606.96]
MAGQATGAASHLLSTQRALVETLTSFLTVATHQILYLRRLYPAISFLSTRAYNYPVRQNRHPAVCNWILDAVAAIRNQLDKNTVEKVALCIYECKSNRVLERWTFDLHSLPAVARRDRDIPFGLASSASTSAAAITDSNPPDEAEGLLLARSLNLTDLEANFRATLSRISTAAAKLRPLPEGPDAPECSFTLAIEVKDAADRPVGRLEKEERNWMAAEPDVFAGHHDPDRVARPVSTTPGNPNNQAGQPRRPLSPKTHPVRRLETGELRMEVWVEESAAKFEYGPPPESASLRASASVAQRRANMSYGAGTEMFHPGGGDGDEDGYDLEPPNVNRKPLGGATTDYHRG